MSAPQAAEKWGISERRVQILCSLNRIPGVSKLGYMWLIPKAAEHRGLSVDMNLDGENVADALAEGKLVVAIMSKGHFTKGGHFIVLRGITADGKVLVADPASLKRSNQEWDLSLILEEARKRVGAGGPFWAISN